MGMESVNFRFSMDARSKIFDFRCMLDFVFPIFDIHRIFVDIHRHPWEPIDIDRFSIDVRESSVLVT